MKEIIEKLKQEQRDIPAYPYNTVGEADKAVQKYQNILREFASINEHTFQSTMGLRSESSDLNSIRWSLARAQTKRDTQSAYERITRDLSDAYRELLMIADRLLVE